MYHQLTSDERYTLSALKKEGYNNSAIARCLGRHRSTIGRELRRNQTTHDGRYRPEKAQHYTNGRRRRSRRGSQFDDEVFAKIDAMLEQWWSPKQISGILRKSNQISISHETVYRYIWKDRTRGGLLYTHLRQSGKLKRKRYRYPDSRGKLPGKRMITERPDYINSRAQRGHWEIDTVMGKGDNHCIVTLVERKTGYVLIGKLKSRTVANLNARVINLILQHPCAFKTITADNGTEFHGYKQIERKTGVKFYFANPHHSWERGSNENTNGLIRQYLPKGRSMAHVTQWRCNEIAFSLNTRPRERYGFNKPMELFYA